MIRLENLSKYYYGNNSVALGLRKINLEFHKGEFVAITGESGSGKTTLLSTISGLLPYEEGEMYFNGSPTSYYDEADWEEYRKNHIAFVFQNYNLIDAYTALENVMISFLIQGESVAYAKEKSMELLETVGIAQYAAHRATELSSGQKQRLAIARALAKNTEVIVADEPTGNLDAENGRQIMALFAELAKERLVIIVTHNYEEASAFVTRKIVIHDAEVEEDIQLQTQNCSTKNSNIKETQKATGPEVNTKRIRENVRVFSKMNIRASMGKSVLLCAILFVVSFASFLFLGNFLANLDDTNTKVYENTAFYNSDDKRIVVRYSDGSQLKEDDFEFLKSLKHVVYTEKYGLVNDLYYFSEKGVDYQVTYNNIETNKEKDPVYEEFIYLDNYSKFVFSTSGLETSDLAYGRLPENTNEVVIYAEDDSLLGSSFPCFFSHQRHWPINAYIRMDMTVCGILKEPTNQYYFSEDLCRVLANITHQYQEYYSFGVAYNNALSFYRSEKVIFYVDDSYQLNKEEMLFSKEKYSGLAEWLYLNIRIYENENYKMIQNLNVNHMESGEPIAIGTHNSTKQFAVVSQELYDVMYSNLVTSQAGVYIEDYAYMDDVLKEIRAAGYEAVAPVRIGSVVYDNAKVTERLITLALSVGALIVLLILEIVIVFAFIKTQKKDAVILKSMGMNQKMLSQINANTLFTYHLIAFSLMLLVALGTANCVPQIKALWMYYRFYHVLLLFVICSLANSITIVIYNHYLANLMKAGSEVKVV